MSRDDDQIYAVEVDHLSKTFRLPKERSGELKQHVINFLRGRKGYTDLKVLRDVSFKIKKGDFFGIVGRNGSGKSTLLKLLAGIYAPTRGTIVTRGTLVPFIELGVGFNPELTGRENVYLNGAMLGFSNDEIDAMYDDIVDFAELHEFMGQKLKNYSSGMQVRLAFSIAIKAQGDILVLDEVLAVGDEAFQRKCNNYFATLRREKKTVILVTHSMDAVQQFCNKALLINDGKIANFGNPANIAQKYRELFIDKGAKVETRGATSANKNISVKASCEIGKTEITLRIEFLPKENLVDSLIVFKLTNDNGEIVYRLATDEYFGKTTNFEKDRTYRITLNIENIFPEGVFRLDVTANDKDRANEYIHIPDLLEFEIKNAHKRSNMDRFWKLKENLTLE